MSEELHELIVAWLGGEISDTQREQLLELLRSDEELRAAFVTETRMFAMLQTVQSAEPRGYPFKMNSVLPMLQRSHSKIEYELRLSSVLHPTIIDGGRKLPY